MAGTSILTRDARPGCGDILTVVNARPVSFRGLKNRLRAIRDAIRQTPSDALQKVRVADYRCEGGLLVRPMLSPSTRPAQAYLDLCALFSNARASRFLLEQIEREWQARQGLEVRRG